MAVEEVREVRDIGQTFAEGNEDLAKKFVEVARERFVTNVLGDGSMQGNNRRWAELILRAIMGEKSSYTPYAHSQYEPTRKQFFAEHGLVDDDCAILFCDGINEHFSKRQAQRVNSE